MRGAKSASEAGLSPVTRAIGYCQRRSFGQVAGSDRPF